MQVKKHLIAVYVLVTLLFISTIFFAYRKREVRVPVTEGVGCITINATDSPLNRYRICSDGQVYEPVLK